MCWSPDGEAETLLPGPRGRTPTGPGGRSLGHKIPERGFEALGLQGCHRGKGAAITGHLEGTVCMAGVRRASGQQWTRLTDDWAEKPVPAHFKELKISKVCFLMWCT